MLMASFQSSFSMLLFKSLQRSQSNQHVFLTMMSKIIFALVVQDLYECGYYMVAGMLSIIIDSYLI